MSKPYPVVVILQEKHGNVYFLAEDAGDIDTVLVNAFMERKEEGCWYEDEEEVAECGSSVNKICRFMQKRRYEEYEGFEIEALETVS